VNVPVGILDSHLASVAIRKDLRCLGDPTVLEFDVVGSGTVDPAKSGIPLIDKTRSSRGFRGYGRYKIRTCDPFRVKEVRYQLKALYSKALQRK
jgi:hypothetical protein